MPVSDTEDRMFAQREIARTKVYAANRMVPEGRPDFETRSEYEFLSSIVSEGPRGSGRLTAMFTPFRGRERAWGATYKIQYEEATRPSVENTRAALRAKYGAWTYDVGADSPLSRSGSLIWYWNDAGRPGSPDTHAICDRGAVAALAQDEDLGFWFPPNLAGTNPARLKTSVDAGCSKVIVASFNWNTDGAVEEMTIAALDLRTAYDSGMELAGVLDGRANADANARREAADRNRPTL
jgi:hypothetical protein